jgi:hypothetical protein
MKNILIIAFIGLTTINFSQEEKENKEHKIEVFTAVNLLRIPEHNIGFNFKLKENLHLSTSVKYMSNIGNGLNLFLNNIDRNQKEWGLETGVMKRLHKIDLYFLTNIGSFKKGKYFFIKKGYDYRDERTNIDCRFYGGLKFIFDYNFSKNVSFYVSLSGAKAYGTKTAIISDEHEATYFTTKSQLTYLWDYSLGFRFKLFKL